MYDSRNSYNNSSYNNKWDIIKIRKINDKHVDNETEQELLTLPKLLLRGVQVGLKTKLCRDFAPFILDIFNEAATLHKTKSAEKKAEISAQMDCCAEDTI